MDIETPVLEALARVLCYPDADTGHSANFAANAFEVRFGPLADALRAVGNLETSDAEERYTRLFDLSPVCTLNVGYHLFGEDYARGLLLANLRMELHRAGLLDDSELPDFLPNLLRLYGRLDDDEDRFLLLEGLVRPGLEKMIGTLKGSICPYAGVVRGLVPLIEALYPANSFAPDAPSVEA